MPKKSLFQDASQLLGGKYNPGEKHYGKYVAYYRVSTKRQGQSGLGLEAQKAAVQNQLNGGRWELLEEFKEVESGRNSRRPELKKAIELCKKKKAVLLVAKLDRLSRNLSFLATMMEGGIEFECCDMPGANKLTLQIMGVIAEDESRRIRK